MGRGLLARLHNPGGHPCACLPTCWCKRTKDGYLVRWYTPDGSTTFPIRPDTPAAPNRSEQQVGRQLMVNAPALRLQGRKAGIRAYKIGRWSRNPLDDVAAACRSSLAVDKALAESVANAHRAGRSWPEIALALGLSADLTTWPEISAALATRRQVVLGLHNNDT
jgi:hypothetical protein